MAEVWLALRMLCCMEGTARVIRIRMTDMTMRSSMRVKPDSWGRGAVWRVFIGAGSSAAQSALSDSFKV